jgi:DNA repair protein RadC
MKRASPNLFTSNLCEIEIQYHNKVKSSEMPKVSCSKDAEGILREVWSDKMEYVEEFMVLCLNRSNKVLGWSKISLGGLHGTVADPKVIFQIALKANASNIILAHNHPSGTIEPSSADISLTNKIKSAGEYLDLTVLDHIILSSESYYSFGDDGSYSYCPLSKS